MTTKPAVHTEVDASRQACVLGVSQVYPLNGGAFAQMIVHRPPCIGSKCQGWRWWTSNIVDESGPRDKDGLRPLVESRDTYGYCGLAGRQE